MNYWRVKTYLTIAILTALAIPAGAADVMSKVNVGDPAPDFTLNDQNGKPVKLSEFQGKSNVVLAFYVLAFTAG